MASGEQWKKSTATASAVYSPPGGGASTEHTQARYTRSANFYYSTFELPPQTHTVPARGLRWLTNGLYIDVVCGRMVLEPPPPPMPVSIAEAETRAELFITTRTVNAPCYGMMEMTAVGQARPEPNADIAT